MQTLLAERRGVTDVMRVLLVDRDIDSIRDCRDRLQHEGEFVVHGAPNVEDACALLASGAFDVVLVSRALWNADGTELVASVQRQKRDTAFVILNEDSESAPGHAEPTPVVQTVERAKADEATYLAAALRSAHEEQRARRRRETMARWLEREAATDRLTGLLTDGAFNERLAAACAEARTRRRSVAIIIADVTGTQMVNRAHGDHIGDDMLRRAAVGISRCIRGNDSAARIGGDEFGVVLEEADIETARRVARRIAHEIDRLNVTEWDGDIPVTLTFGVASGYACSPEQLLEAARAQLAPRVAARPAYLQAWGWRDDDGPSVA